MEELLQQLNKEQLACATELEKNCSVIACPGSGKTHTIEIKCGYTLSENPKARITAVTFTRDAAKELSERISNSIGAEARRVTTGTFHALAGQQVRNADSKRHLLSEAMQRQIIWRAMERAKVKMSYEEAIKSIDFCKTQLDNTIPEGEDKTLLKHYQDILTNEHAMDYADMLIFAIKGMRDGTIKHLPCEFMFVDEFQDADPLQYAWIAEHAKTGIKITTVGDDDQSIYAFRHALGYSGMTRFEKEFDATRTVLGTNYRSHYEILSAAEALIQYNQTRMSKSLYAHKGSGGSVKFKSYADKTEEVEDCCQYIYKNYNDWTILARNNSLLDPMEKELTAFKIPYQRLGGKSIWSKNGVVHFLELLRALVTNKKSSVNCVLHYVGLSDKQISAIEQIANNFQIETLNLIALDVKKIKKELTQGQYRALNKMNELLPGWKKQVVKSGRETLVIKSCGEWLATFSPSDFDEGMIRIAIDGLSKLNGKIMERLQYVNECSRKSKDSKEGVKLNTLHSAKGLQYKRVWMIGLNNGVLPHSKSDDDEERRLCYVGMTRAQEELVLSANLKKTISKFIVEAGLLDEDKINKSVA